MALQFYFYLRRKKKHWPIESIDRLKETGDLFKGVLGKGIDLEKTIKKAQSIFG